MPARATGKEAPGPAGGGEVPHLTATARLHIPDLDMPLLHQPIALNTFLFVCLFFTINVSYLVFKIQLAVSSSGSLP